MDKDLYTLLNTVKLVDVVVTTALFVVIVGIIVSQKNNIKQFLERWREKRNFEDNIVETLDNMKDTDAKLKKGLEEIWDTMDKSREVSKEVRKEMYSDMKEISKDLKTVMKSINDMEEKNNLSKRANLKEKIERIYWECHKNMTCTDTSFETLKDLIEDYERHGGTNSFVHTLVLPEMYTWRRLKAIPDPDPNNEERK